MKPRTRATMWTLLIAFALMTTGSFVNVAAQESAATLKDVQRFLGEWVIIVESPRGTSDGTFEVINEGGTISAVLVMREGADPQNISDIKKTREGLELRYEANFGGNAFEMIMKIRRDDDAVLGTLSNESGDFTIDIKGISKTLAEALDEAGQNVREEIESRGERQTRRRRRRRGPSETSVVLGEKQIKISFTGVDQEDPGFKQLSEAAAGDVIGYTGGLAIKLRTELEFQAGDAVIKTENVAKDYPGVYSLWLKKTADGWNLVFNEKADVWGTQHDPGADVAEVPLEVSTPDEPAEKLTVSLEETDDGARFTLAWGAQQWSLGFVATQ